MMELSPQLAFAAAGHVIDRPTKKVPRILHGFDVAGFHSIDLGPNEPITFILADGTKFICLLARDNSLSVTVATAASATGQIAILPSSSNAFRIAAVL